ncbi:hypothetical protein RN001_010784 [Aquatica leii]|uniref:Uncharacterized protein n=1 Tax=Aquatica leii TaxID=1421715 RepID=A0AAN7SNF5_9COLE|nr:hypothetical protein RN001_010784 [Aquatica leii]
MNMDTKLCRICGKLSENYVHIFKTEGLKNKIETCLPIIVSPHCLLPDTICSECLENVDNFYSFIKNCLQNIIVLEAQYDIMESCLKTKRKHEKGSFVDFSTVKYDKNVQTDEDFSDLLLQREESHRNTLHFNYIEMEKLSAALLNAENILNGKEPDAFAPVHVNFKPITSDSKTLVNYDIETEGESDEESRNNGRVILVPRNKKHIGLSCRNQTHKKYFDDVEIDLINEIAQRKSLKRKCDTVLMDSSKMFKLDSGNRRKNRQPKKLEPVKDCELPNLTFNSLESFYKVMNDDRGEEEQPIVPQAEKEETYSLPQLCLLCDLQFSGPTTLAAHIYEMHGIDMAQVISSEPVMERKKKLPNLVKITDLKIKSENDTTNNQAMENPPTLRPTFVCPICPAVLTNRSDLFSHLKAKHPRHASLLCGLCMHVANSFTNLTVHLDTCKQQHNITTKYICKICSYYDDNSKVMENHIAVHDFILDFCKKQSKMFDPCDYVEINKNSESANKSLTCTECNQGGFVTFKEFSTHRRSQHQIFHCDLCNKFYGRNSHLWKHVNRLHKGHPSITCQLCYKTSASKYHLAQHFNKIHSAKPLKQKQETPPNDDTDFMKQKFQGFDFQSVRQSFMRQELLDQDGNSEGEIESDLKVEIKNEYDCSDLELYVNDPEDFDIKIPSSEPKPQQSLVSPPKEIDSSSDLYTNIITNYTPPQNEGEYKCPKCFKGFHKKTLLKKHKKNCRPRLQKDLLTRCKTCSRIFKDRQSLTKHLINYHSEYACEICGQKVQSKCEIVSHIRFSHPNCHLFCHCGNILRSKTDLAEHKQDHRNSFVCQFCADMLPTKIKLKMHILSLHRKILSLSCGICLKLFETQHILRDHVCLVHKDQLLPLTSCTVCGKNYGSKWKTYDHLNKSHGRIFKACKSCLEVFDTEEELQQHFESQHVNSTQVKVVAAKAVPSSEENGDKNSSSEASNDSFVKTNGSDEEDVTKNAEIPDVTSVENKISLLEKRLMGNKKSLDGEASIANSILSSITKSKLNSIKQLSDSRKDKKCSKGSEGRKEPSDELDASLQNTSQNSSKRTVYVNSNDPSFCEICLKTWPAKKHLWQHYIRRHKTVAATVCGICLKTNDSYKALQTHLWENHPKLLHGQGFGSNFICRICGRYHNASSKLRLHMAIHENFDWSILDGLELQKTTSDAIASKKESQTSNGYFEANANDNPSINYESLIEQVECSSNSDESDLDDVKGAEKYSTNNVNSSSDEESDSESVMSVNEGNSLESQMLHNMLREKFVTDVKVEPAEITADKLEYSSTDSEESSDSNDTASETEPEAVNLKTTTDDESSQFSRTSKDSEQKYEGANMFSRKSDELDSAIRSISYEEINEVRETIPMDICDVHPQILNQHEIQSAVDSIL